MEPLIQISKLNDFVFCPYSLYLHSIYDGFDSDTYHQNPQKVGKLKHANIDNATYSSATKYLQGKPVYSEKYKLIGKIDIYDKETKSLIDRKTKIKKIYAGYKYQLYGQYFCMIEEGFAVEKLFLHSLTDNKRYEVPIPDKTEIQKFENLLTKIWEFYGSDAKPDVPASKCQNCIYNSLCAYAKLT